ncbi:helix-turn-helix domain-containing protein [Lysinibacillus sphaericus]|uniref:helix-turn-helix domain-containing protein n=1 Tax=Lysinibacillus sphaericus TaxID=1421 RepID=UPI0037F68071
MNSNIILKPNKELVAVRINEIRDELNLSIGIMAEKLGISKSTLNSYIRAIAMPPEDIIYKISIMSGKSIEWIKFGEEYDYIRQVIQFNGYTKFLEDYPDMIDKVLEDCQEYKVYPIENRYVNDMIVMQLFHHYYYPIFERNIDEVIKKYVDEIHKYPIYTGDDEYQRFKYSNRVHMEISGMKEQVKYGEIDKILHIAETEFKNRVDSYFRNNKKKGIKDFFKKENEVSFCSDFPKKLKERKSTKEVIDYLAKIYKEDFNLVNEAADETIEAFQNLGVELERIYSNYSKKDLKKVFMKNEN